MRRAVEGARQMDAELSETSQRMVAQRLASVALCFICSEAIMRIHFERRPYRCDDPALPHYCDQSVATARLEATQRAAWEAQLEAERRKSAADAEVITRVPQKEAGRPQNPAPQKPQHWADAPQYRDEI